MCLYDYVANEAGIDGACGMTGTELSQVPFLDGLADLGDMTLAEFCPNTCCENATP